MTAEHKVECHRLARNLRAVGKPTWTHSAKVFPGETPANDATKIEAGKQIAAALKAQLPTTWLNEAADEYDDDYADIVWELDHIGWEGADVSEHLSNAVESLYDWADIKRVWLQKR
jgi:hypothetical protein